MRILPLCLLVILCGCVAGSDLNMRGAIGKHCSQLVAVRGAPDQTMSDGKDGEVWVYLVRREWVTAGQASTTFDATGYEYGRFYGGTYHGQSSIQGQATTVYTPSRTGGYMAHRAFFINKDGIVYRYVWQGL